MKIYEYPDYVYLDKSKDMYKQFKELASAQPDEYRIVERFSPFIILLHYSNVQCVKYYVSAFYENNEARLYFECILNGITKLQ